MRRAVVGLAVATLLAGCTPPAPPPGPATPPATAPPAAGRTEAAPPALRRFYDQRPTWRPCGELSCTDVTVPLDYEEPAGATIDLAVARRPATSPRRGTLFVNPGGPGGSGTAYAASFRRDGLTGWDVVGWDPRGVGGSSGLTCLTGRAFERYVGLDLSPETDAERDALVAGSRRFGQACADRSGAIVGHVSSQENARDLDVLRAVLGEERVHYAGQSYGTLLGAWYAELFPGRVGRMLLDAAVDLGAEPAVPQSLGAERALRDFARWCAGRDDCDLGAGPDAVVSTVGRLLRSLDAKPLRAGGRTIGDTEAMWGISAALYAGPSAYPLLARALGAARRGDTQALALGAERFGTFDPRALASFQAIWCADHAPLTVSQATRAWASDTKRAPVFGRVRGPNVMCTDWPVAARPAADLTAAQAPPILVVGARYDPATPYEWSRDAASRLASAVLLTYEGAGHGAWSGGRSGCVDAAMIAYLNEGTLPADGTRCD